MYPSIWCVLLWQVKYPSKEITAVDFLALEKVEHQLWALSSFSPIPMSTYPNASTRHPGLVSLLRGSNHFNQVVATSTARNIGVIMDSKAPTEAHVLSVCKSSFIHIRNLSKIRKFVDSSSLECHVHAFITTKLDYCNSLLCGAPSTLINTLQRIQNIVARIITGHGRCEHITPVLKSLHWLPVHQRIKF